MSTNPRLQRSAGNLFACALAVLIAGCATTDQTSKTEAAGATTSGRVPTKYRATDGRTIEIGPRVASEGGWSFKEPHLTKCWIADGFNFTGYDALYLAPTLSTAQLHGPDEERPHQLAKENLVLELNRILGPQSMFATIATRESDLPSGARVLRLENTIVEYAKGGGGARYWAGLFGAGQPILLVQGKMTDGQKTLFSYEARRSGVSAGARMSGAFMRDEDIQLDDIRSMALDLSDFMAAIAGKYQPKN